jgi:hypothetical protein
MSPVPFLLRLLGRAPDGLVHARYTLHARRLLPQDRTSIVCGSCRPVDRCSLYCTYYGLMNPLFGLRRPRLRRADTGKKSAPLPSHACRTLASGASPLAPLWTHTVWGFRLKFKVVRKKTSLPTTVYLLTVWCVHTVQRSAMLQGSLEVSKSVPGKRIPRADTLRYVQGLPSWRSKARLLSYTFDTSLCQILHLCLLKHTKEASTQTGRSPI